MCVNVSKLGVLVLLGMANWSPSAWADSDCADSAAFTIDNVTVHFAGVIGRVIEDGGGDPPVAAATVVLSPGGHVTTTLGDGTFEFQDVPIASGYGLEVTAEGYELVAISPVDVLVGVNDLGDIFLTPLTGTYALLPLADPIHDGTSQVEEGCLAYRYFRVVRAGTTDPIGGVGIRVRPVGGSEIDQGDFAIFPGWAGETPGLSEGSGIVRLCIPASEIGGPGSSETFETVLPNDSVGPTFDVMVQSRVWEHGWTQSVGKGVDVGIDLGVGVSVGEEHGYSGGISRPVGGAGDVEQVWDGDLRGLSFGVGVGLPIAGAAYVNDAIVGVAAGAEVGLYAEFDRQFGYGFDTYAPADGPEAMLRFYCLYATAPGAIFGSPFDWIMEGVRTFVEPDFLGSNWRWSEAGFEVGGYGEVGGMFGTTVGPSFPMSGRMELDGEIGGRARFRYDAAEEMWTLKFGFAGDASADLGIGVGFASYAPPGRPAAFKAIMNHLGFSASFSGWVAAEQLFEIAVPHGADRPDATRLITRGGGTLGEWDAMSNLVGGTDPGEIDVIVEIEVEQPISSYEDWEKAASLPGILDLEAGTFAPLINAAFGDNLITGLFGNHDYDEDMRYRYSAELAAPYQLEIGASGSLVISLGVHFDAEVAQTRSFELEHGIIRGSDVFPLQTTSGASGVPSNTVSILDIQAGWVDAFWDWLWSWDPFLDFLGDVIDWIFGRGDELIQVTTSAGAADLFVPDGTYPSGTEMTIESWADEAVLTNGWMYGIGGMYRFDADVEPAGPMSLQIWYLDESVVDVPEADLQIYRRDTDQQTWELVGGVVDVNANTVTADIDADGLYTVAPPLPAGEIDHEYSATVLPADGTSTAIVESTDLLLNTGMIVADGELYTVRVQGMEIVTPDADPDMDDVQVVSLDGTILIEFLAPEYGGIGAFVVKSVLGTAVGSGMIAFEDDTAPPIVPDVQLVSGQSRVWVSWDDSGMPADIAYYRVQYSKDHAPPPFDGTAQVEGNDSPVHVAGTPCLLRGLDADAEYHVAVSAVDVSGNEGPLSSVVTAITAEAPPTPPVGVSFAAGEADHYEVSWALSEDDGFNDRDVDHYEVFRWVVPGAIGVHVADVPAGVAVYMDDVSGLPPQAFVMYEVAAVDTGGLSSERVGLPFDPDVDEDGDVDLDDYAEFVDCLSGPGSVPASVPECLDGFDTEGDGDVDLKDFQAFQLIFGG